MTHASLFTGIGGFDEAAEKMGWENAFHCEWDDFCQMILKQRWPNATSYTDIKQTDFTIWRGRIDILTGGFPCQPYSQAGKRLGKDDDRHLWPEMLRSVREIQPTWVVGENVRGLVNWNGGMVFDEVQADLEAIGYEVTPYILPACAVNAPHRRDRVWFVAFNPNTDRYGQHTGNRNHEKHTGEGWEHALGNISEGIEHGNVANNNNKGLERCQNEGSIGSIWKKRKEQHIGYVCPEWKDFPTQSPVRTGNDGFPTGPLRQRIREDSMGTISEEEIDKILSEAANEWCARTIKAGGNAIVHQVAIQIFKAIETYDTGSDIAVSA